MTFFTKLNIVVTGPECTGKTWLTKMLSQHYQTIWTPEYARSYLETIERPYIEKDLLEIAKRQLLLQQSNLLNAQRYLFSDTGLLVLKIWSEIKYGRTDPWIEEQLKKGHYDFFLLCAPDLSWTFDPLRENPHDREALFLSYEKTLKALNFPYAIVTGTGETRLQNAISAFEIFLKKRS